MNKNSFWDLAEIYFFTNTPVSKNTGSYSPTVESIIKYIMLYVLTGFSNSSITKIMTTNH